MSSPGIIGTTTDRLAFLNVLSNPMIRVVVCRKDSAGLAIAVSAYREFLPMCICIGDRGSLIGAGLNSYAMFADASTEY